MCNLLYFGRQWGQPRMTPKSDLKLYSVHHIEKTLSLVGKWRNELSSVMTVTSLSNEGLFSGSYESRVSGNGKLVLGKLTGYLAGDTIGFSVDWRPTFDSVTSWAGKVLAAPDGSPLIYTLWTLSRGMKDETDWWQSFLSGSDRFWREGP